MQQRDPKVKQEYIGNRGDILLKGIPTETLSMWVRLKEHELFDFLVGIFRDRRAQWARTLTDRTTFKTRCDELGVGVEFFQGAFQETAVFEDTFKRMEDELQRRRMRGEEPENGTRTHGNREVTNGTRTGNAAHRTGQQPDGPERGGSSGGGDIPDPFTGLPGPKGSRFGYRHPQTDSEFSPAGTVRQRG